MALRVFKVISALKMVVLVGLVVGTTPQMTPTGSASVVIPVSSSSSTMSHVFRFLYALGYEVRCVWCWEAGTYLYTNSAANWFFITLSSTTPMPVSSTASLARGMRAALAAWVCEIKSTTMPRAHQGRRLEDGVHLGLREMRVLRLRCLDAFEERCKLRQVLRGRRLPQRRRQLNIASSGARADGGFVGVLRSGSRGSAHRGRSATGLGAGQRWHS